MNYLQSFISAQNAPAAQATVSPQGALPVVPDNSSNLPQNSDPQAAKKISDKKNATNPQMKLERPNVGVVNPSDVYQYSLQKDLGASKVTRNDFLDYGNGKTPNYENDKKQFSQKKSGGIFKTIISWALPIAAVALVCKYRAKIPLLKNIKTPKFLEDLNKSKPVKILKKIAKIPGKLFNFYTAKDIRELNKTAGDVKSTSKVKTFCKGVKNFFTGK